MKPRPQVSVEGWIAANPLPDPFTTAVTQAEVGSGLAILPPGQRRDALARAARTMFEAVFEGRVLPFDQEAADAYATLVAERRRVGRPISPFDAQIAAIARSRGAALATRDTRDFEGCGVKLLDPWL